MTIWHIFSVFLYSAQDSRGPPRLRAGSGVMWCFPRPRCDQWERSICLGKRRQWYIVNEPVVITSIFIIHLLVFVSVWFTAAASQQRTAWLLGPCFCSSDWKVASGSAPKTPTTLHSRCVYLWNLRPRGWCVGSTAPWSSAPRTALWLVAATGNYLLLFLPTQNSDH